MPNQVEPRIANHVSSALAGVLLRAEISQLADGSRDQKRLRDCPTIHVHLLVVLSTGLNIDHHWREYPRHRGGGEKDLAEQIKSLRFATRRNRPDVPDYRALHIQIGSADQQQPPLLIF